MSSLSDIEKKFGNSGLIGHKVLRLVKNSIKPEKFNNTEVAVNGNTSAAGIGIMLVVLLFVLVFVIIVLGVISTYNYFPGDNKSKVIHMILTILTAGIWLQLVSLVLGGLYGYGLSKSNTANTALL
tara:strand:- start:661 stop:1038 length:378 start_codon:yes stop_codon:yes gene_type:complete